MCRRKVQPSFAVCFTLTAALALMTLAKQAEAERFTLDFGAQQKVNPSREVQIGPWKVDFKTWSRSEKAIGDYRPDAEQDFVIVNLIFQNVSKKSEAISEKPLTATLSTKSGDAADWLGLWLASDGEDPIDEVVAPGHKLALRAVFRVVKRVEPKALKLHWESGSKEAPELTGVFDLQRLIKPKSEVKSSG